MDEGLERQLAHLKNLPLEKLRAEWRSALGTEPPACRSREILKQILAWRIQEKALGGLSPESRRRLKQLAGAFGRNPNHKLAASKKKGIWIGGIPPLGYDVRYRKLMVNKEEAKQVRLIFQRHLELGSVPDLVVDLKERGIRTKA